MSDHWFGSSRISGKVLVGLIDTKLTWSTSRLIEALFKRIIPNWNYFPKTPTKTKNQNLHENEMKLNFSLTVRTIGRIEIYWIFPGPASATHKISNDFARPRSWKQAIFRENRFAGFVTWQNPEFSPKTEFILYWTQFIQNIFELYL
jgi:hypothetical protein